MADVRSIQEGLALMAKVLANPPAVDGELVAAWQAIMGPDISGDEFKEECLRYLRRPGDGFFPSPPKFLAAMQNLTDEEAELAWQRALCCLRASRGLSGSLNLDDADGDPCVLWALGRLGVSYVTADDKGFRRAEFVRLWKAAKMHGYGLSYIAGECETQNRLRGLKVDRPALVGRPDWEPPLALAPIDNMSEDGS